MTLVRLITFRSAIFASFVRISSCTPSTNAAASSLWPHLLDDGTSRSLRFSNGRTAIPVVSGCRINSLFQTIHPAAAARAIRDGASSALVGLRRIHLLLRPMIPVCRAKIGSCFSQRSKSSASAKAEEYRRIGSFSRHLRQIVERSRSTLGFSNRGGRGSVSSSNLIVSYVVPPANGG